MAIAGFGWMGRVHTQAYARVLHHFPQLAVAPQLVAVADEVPGRAEEAADQFGFTKPTRDWREVAADPDVAAVSIAAPNFLHREIGVAMARAGKHIWIEKPVGLTADDARAVADAVKQAGVMGAVGFNYRNAPAVAAAKEMVESGELGTVTHVRFRLFSDYAAHPEGALSWRFERERGGSGVLGDLAAHGVDLARYLLGEIDALTADTAIFLAERARPTGATAGHQRATGGELGPVENEDYVTSLVRFASGARGVLEASRIAVGEQNNYGFEIHGTKGAVFWDFRRMNELGVSIRRRLPGPGRHHAVRRPDARLLRRVPAGVGDEHGLRRPEGDRGVQLPALDRRRHAARHDPRRRGAQRGGARRDGGVGADGDVGVAAPVIGGRVVARLGTAEDLAPRRATGQGGADPR